VQGVVSPNSAAWTIILGTNPHPQHAKHSLSIYLSHVERFFRAASKSSIRLTLPRNSIAFTEAASATLRIGSHEFTLSNIVASNYHNNTKHVFDLDLVSLIGLLTQDRLPQEFHAVGGSLTILISWTEFNATNLWTDVPGGFSTYTFNYKAIRLPVDNIDFEFQFDAREHTFRHWLSMVLTFLDKFQAKRYSISVAPHEMPSLEQLHRALKCVGGQLCCGGPSQA
jgi:hypothetical protein